MPGKKIKIPKKKKVIPLPPVRLSPADLIPVKISSNNTDILLRTVASGDLETYRRLIRHFEYTNEVPLCDSNGSTALHIAAKRNDLTFLSLLLLMKKIDVNALEKKIIGGYAAIHHACQHDSTQAVLELLQAGADPNIRCNSDFGYSPLHLCCRCVIRAIMGYKDENSDFIIAY